MLSKRHEILVVEDHADSAQVLARILRKMGHHVHTAASCDASRILFRLNSRIDVLLVDLGLPDGDGCDLLRELLAFRKVHAVAVTGHGMGRDIQRCKDAGFIAHITKPFVLTALSDVLANLKLDGATLSIPKQPGEN